MEGKGRTWEEEDWAKPFLLPSIYWLGPGVPQISSRPSLSSAETYLETSTLVCNLGSLMSCQTLRLCEYFSQHRSSPLVRKQTPGTRGLGRANLSPSLTPKETPQCREQPPYLPSTPHCPFSNPHSLFNTLTGAKCVAISSPKGQASCLLTRQTARNAPKLVLSWAAGHSCTQGCLLQSLPA